MLWIPSETVNWYNLVREQNWQGSSDGVFAMNGTLRTSQGYPSDQ